MTDFVAPDQKMLKAYAGWAISRRSDAVSDAQSLALGKFADGCGDLAENYPTAAEHREDITSRVAKVCTLEKASSSGGPAPVGSRFPPGPAFLMPMSGVHGMMGVLNRLDKEFKCEKESDHMFDIKTQRCFWCQKTYREIKGRAPELM